jgi:ABC-type hemin transport system substrate-binding protein
LVVIIMGLMVGGCGQGPEPAADDAGPRLVVLSPALAVILRDVGAESLMVGRHDFDQVFTDLPACGHQGGIDYERLLTLEPTHVLIEWGSRALPPRLVSLAEANGWEIERYEIRTLEDILSAAEALETEFGPKSITEPIRDSLEQAWARSEVPLGRVGRVLLLAATGPPGALGPGSFHYEILERLGATLAMTRGGPWVELDSEDIIALAPDAIVLVVPRPGGAGIGAVGVDAVAKLGGIGSLDIPAVRSGRVAVLDGVSYLTPSTAMGDFARNLREVLEGWAEEEGP